MTKQDIIEFIDAIEITKRECKNQYALAYLYALEESYRDYGRRGLRVQLLYVMSNLNGWRGENAKRAKQIFKKIVEILTQDEKAENDVNDTKRQNRIYN